MAQRFLRNQVLILIYVNVIGSRLRKDYVLNYSNTFCYSIDYLHLNAPTVLSQVAVFLEKIHNFQIFLHKDISYKSLPDR